ncbi:MAG: sulfatase-like hydrolase/transferase, partial [Cyclobacteriaceae bacterium]|nr:sulfatase-like hydrolase/transferase [Cyclobacteriaceae bacterium]
WFCSDNGPSYIHDYNSSGGLRGKKAELYEGGIRVPAILEWPERFEGGQVSNYPSSTSDFLPTILAVCGLEQNGSMPMDGQDILPFFMGQDTGRNLFFQSPLPGRLKKSNSTKEEQFAVLAGDYKLISMDNGRSYQLYNIEENMAETIDLSMDFPGKVQQMKSALDEWRKSCMQSADGLDYVNN